MSVGCDVEAGGFVGRRIRTGEYTVICASVRQPQELKVKIENSKQQTNHLRHNPPLLPPPTRHPTLPINTITNPQRIRHIPHQPHTKQTHQRRDASREDRCSEGLLGCTEGVCDEEVGGEGEGEG